MGPSAKTLRLNSFTCKIEIQEASYVAYRVQWAELVLRPIPQKRALLRALSQCGRECVGEMIASHISGLFKEPEHYTGCLAGPELSKSIIPCVCLHDVCSYADAIT